MAKYNLETLYSVVGLVEHFNTSISVMEQYLPGKAEGIKKNHSFSYVLNIFSVLFGSNNKDQKYIP